MGDEKFSEGSINIQELGTASGNCSDCSTEEGENNFNVTKELSKQRPRRQTRLATALEDYEVIFKKNNIKERDVKAT